MTDTDSTTRRTILQALGVGALGMSAGTVAGQQGPPEGVPANENARDKPATGGADQHRIDPIFGLPSAERNPCFGDADESCLEEFGRPTRPDHEVEGHIDLPGPVLAAAEHGLSDATIADINDAAADGDVDATELDSPDEVVDAIGLTVLQIAQALSGTEGFHFEPAGIHIHPGDILLFSAETPDHMMVAYHQGHGRQNRVPDGVGPITSPLVPVGGSWRYRFEEPGVYDFNCPPHEFFGMTMRVVVHGDGDVPEPSIEQTGRPPVGRNFFPTVFGGLDPNIPSAAAALASPLLDPAHIVAAGRVSWHDLVDEYRER